MVKQSKGLTVFLAAVIAALVLSASIAVPLLCRPFYYAHIEALELPAYLGLEAGEIRRAFDEMMDFCIGLTDEFSTGVLPWSQSGYEHFVDVKKLFVADLWALGISAALLVGDLLLRDRRKGRLYRFLGRGPGFGRRPDWAVSLRWWVCWRQLTSAGPSSSSTRSSFPERPTGCLIGAPMPSS